MSRTGMTPLDTGMTEEGGAAVLDEKAGSQWALLHRYSFSWIPDWNDTIIK
ncbi:hypothetical protein [Wolbachia endosymbiont (group A) of Bibio marci]|uniref:hypothetical protein n=1 Tax=Wolbachia endosymbiont (group A) of Bibio marci TaxID=2953987 RepID=UPI002231EF7C|nr:hypothetical protein [Wolbachia endosymbiont (group A) of Bibio marci]